MGSTALQKQLGPSFSNKTSPNDLSSFVIQFYFPVTVKGLKACGRLQWNNLCSNRKTRRANYTNSLWVNQGFTKLERNLRFEERIQTTESVLSSMSFPRTKIDGSVDRHPGMWILPDPNFTPPYKQSHHVMTVVDLSKQFPIFSDIHLNVSEVIHLEMFLGLAPFLKMMLRKVNYLLRKL